VFSINYLIFLDPNIFLSTFVSKTFRLYSSLTVGELRRFTAVHSKSSQHCTPLEESWICFNCKSYIASNETRRSRMRVNKNLEHGGHDLFRVNILAFILSPRKIIKSYENTTLTQIFRFTGQRGWRQVHTKAFMIYLTITGYNG
jgi:hypothetical protein